MDPSKTQNVDQNSKNYFPNNEETTKQPEIKINIKDEKNVEKKSVEKKNVEKKINNEEERDIEKELNFKDEINSKKVNSNKDNSNKIDSDEIDPIFETRTNDQKDLEWIKEEITEEPSENKELKWPKRNKIVNEVVEEPRIINQENKIINEDNTEFIPSQEDEIINEEDAEFVPIIQMENLNKKIELTNKNYKTPVDEIFEYIESYQKIGLDELAKHTKLSYSEVEKITKMFEGEGIVEIDYPTSLNRKPTVTLKKGVKPRLEKKPEGKIIEKYNLLVDKVPATISIILSSEENRLVYNIELVSVGTYTKKYLDFIKTEIAETMPIELEEIIDPQKAQRLKDRFFEESKKRLTQHFPNLNEETIDMLSGVVLHEMYGLGEIEILIGDEMLEEIANNSAKTPITVYHRVHGWLKTNMLPGDEEEILNYASQIGRKIGREITNLTPILDAHLLSGDRVNATLSPISSEGNTITIRRFARKPWTIVDFIGKAHTMNSEMAATLWLAMQYELNILIAGGTASGKTSALNSMLALVPSYHRIISIEDVREIVLPKFLEWNWIPLVTRSPNPEGLGEVTMLDLMITSLRMRPDRIIVGEIRRKKEAEVLMEAIETGHSIYSTIHANSSYQVLRRLAEPPINIPLMQIELIDLIVVQYRDRKTNKRRTYEIAEIEKTSTGQGLQINTIYKWVPRTDGWEKLNKPTKLITLLNAHTGMTEEDINREIKERKRILEWLKEINLNELNDIGYIVKMFYSYPETIKKFAKEKII